MVSKGKAVALLLAIVATPLLMAAKCGESSRDDAPEKLIATVDAKYPKEVPMTNGAKCTYGSFAVTALGGSRWSVCARSASEYSGTDVGDRYER